MQCGTCCQKGGPALHIQDLSLLTSNLLPRKDCITIRKGELAHNPLQEGLEATTEEIIKLRGSGGQWSCCYLNPQNNNCTIHGHRPIACRTLQCWSPEASLAMIGKDLLSRKLILKEEHELYALTVEYDKKIPLPDFGLALKNVQKWVDSNRDMLEDLLNADLRFRDKQVALSPKLAEEELFLFGRPVFQLLQSLGIPVLQKGGGLCLQKS